MTQSGTYKTFWGCLCRPLTMVTGTVHTAEAANTTGTVRQARRTDRLRHAGADRRICNPDRIPGFLIQEYYGGDAHSGLLALAAHASIKRPMAFHQASRR
jgi:hypothetical protein